MSKLKEMPPKFLPPEWWLTNEVHYRSAEAERSRSERLIAESHTLVEESDRAAQRMQQDVNKKLEQRIQDIKFWREELNKKLEEMVQEIDVLMTFSTRVEKALEGCSEPLRVTLQCLAEREKHVGIDLVHDEVERELMKETEVIQGVRSLLQRTLEQTKEQMRLNRSAKYHLEKDLRDKIRAEQIDGHCSILTNTSPGLNAETYCSVQGTNVTPEGWENFSHKNVSKAEQERNNSLALRALIDCVLEQTCADMHRQHQAAGTALELRIQEIKNAKEQLEDHLDKVLAEMANQERNLASLQLAIQAKQGPLAVAQSRLAMRSQRPSNELCHDAAHTQLIAEVQELSDHIKRLNMSLSQAEMELRALTQSQLSLEEQIQVKSNSLYIDEVICSQLHQPIVIHKF